MFVVDANIAFSFFDPDSARRKLVKMLPRKNIPLVMPEFAVEELEEMEDVIKEFANTARLEFKLVLALLERRVATVPEEQYSDFLDVAAESAPHTKDVPYFALSLRLDCPPWSDEKAFKEQDEVDVYNTSELVSTFLN